LLVVAAAGLTLRNAFERYRHSLQERRAGG
jgi:hypothetical protein